VELRHWIRQAGRLGVPAMKRGLADLLKHLQEKGLLVLEMTVQDRFRDARGPGDLLGRRVLVTECDKQLLGLGQELPFPIGLAHARKPPGSVGPAALRGAHRHPHGTSWDKPATSKYSIP